MAFDLRSLAFEPWRKLAIGSRIGLGDPYAQNLRSSYFTASNAIVDNKTLYVVVDVDLDQVIDFESPSGRLAAFVNLYAVL